MTVPKRVAMGDWRCPAARVDGESFWVDGGDGDPVAIWPNRDDAEEEGMKRVLTVASVGAAVACGAGDGLLEGKQRRTKNPKWR
ncbi:hypothetical protein GUJ93_ZPchr0004g39515 [Zizania palustris]|uniref:Uncharacterized protein n=1 Tax=Zizania palustris TaxID=103762 RepID=A0A8J5VFV6_ZIZPA|nr:hypothetical protein GUJ93_ZPchr0004g39515 [Zizania palustris]